MPTDEVFNEIKDKSIELWRSRYSDEYGYVSEKVARIESIENVKDNWCSIIGMFDNFNQSLLFAKLSKYAINYLYTQQDNYGIDVSCWISDKSV